MPVTTNEIIDQRLELQELIGKERAAKLMTILDKYPCPHCGSHKLDFEGNLKRNGVVIAGERLFVGDFFFRANCKDCRAQYVPGGVIEFGGFGII